MRSFQCLCFLAIVFSCCGIKNESCQHIEKNEDYAYSEDIIEELSPIGYQQCVKTCTKLTDCINIVYNRIQLSCKLMKNPESNRFDNTSLQYNEKGSCATCGPGEVCVDLKAGSNVCIEFPRTCPNGDVMFGNKCYYFSGDLQTWVDAREICRSRNGCLVTIGTEAVNQFIVETFQGEYQSGNDRNVNTEYVWDESGQHFSFTQWFPGEPGNATTQNCIVINTRTGLWNDDSCLAIVVWNWYLVQHLR